MNKIELLPMNEETLIKAGDTFNKEGTTFNVLERAKNYTISKQTMSLYSKEIVVGYEVAEIRLVADAIYKNGGWVQTGKKAEYYPGGSSFGKNPNEKTFPPRSKEEAMKYFENIKKSI